MPRGWGGYRRYSCAGVYHAGLQCGGLRAYQKFLRPDILLSEKNEGDERTA